LTTGIFLALRSEAIDRVVRPQSSSATSCLSVSSFFILGCRLPVLFPCNRTTKTDAKKSSTIAFVPLLRFRSVGLELFV
jgi:hypothetical protein